MEGQDHEAIGLQDTRAEATRVVEASTTSAASNDEPNEDNVDVKISRSTNAIVHSWNSKHEPLPWNPLRVMAPPRSLGFDSYTSFPGPGQTQRSSQMVCSTSIIRRVHSNLRVGPRDQSLEQDSTHRRRLPFRIWQIA